MTDKIFEPFESFSDVQNIILQNQAWEKIAVSESPPATVIRSDDGRIDTLAGYGTTHHTNSLFFQEEGKIDNNTVQIPIAAKHPGTKAIPPYRVSVTVKSPLFPHHVNDADISLLEERFKEDILWSLTGGIPDDVSDCLEKFFFFSITIKS